MSLGGIILKKPILTKKDKAVAANNLSQITPKDTVVIIDDEEDIDDLDNLTRLNRLYKEHYYGIGQKVVTKSGLYLGKVFDLLMDSDTFLIKKIYVKRLLTERLIFVSNIIAYNKNTFVVKEDFESARVGVIEAESSIA